VVLVHGAANLVFRRGVLEIETLMPHQLLKESRFT
jgi:hypothetical protein